MKKHLISILLTALFLVVLFLIGNYVHPITEWLTQGMTNRESRRVEAFILVLPIFLLYFLVDFLRKKYNKK